MGLLRQVATLIALQGSSPTSDEMDRLRAEFDAERRRLEAALKEQKGTSAEVRTPQLGLSYCLVCFAY